MGFGIFSTLFLWILTRNFPNIIGWNFYEILFVSSFNMFCYSFSLIFFIQIQDIDNYVRNGEFDRILIRPMDSLLQFAALRFNINSLGTVLYSLTTLIYAMVHIPNWDAVSVGKMSLLMISGIIVSLSVQLILGSTAFITLQSAGLFQLQEVVYGNMSNYPITIFSKGIQFFLTFILPIGFIGFYPSTAILGKGNVFFGQDSWLICVMVAFILGIVGYLLWNRSIQRYSGAGS